jgi:2-keto-3-deoxy-L-rhamnonate aldolase RhmA
LDNKKRPDVNTGLDFVRVDTEYSWRRDDALEHMIRAAVIAEVTPMIRVEKGNQYLISKALQIGAGAILVSDITDQKEAIDAVKAAKFQPNGIRGMSSFSFSAGWSAKGGPDWIKWSNAEILVGVMIENEQIMEQINEIFAIDGLDYCLFGPADYSMSIGLGSPQKNHPDVQDALKRTLEAANKHHKSVGIGIAQPWEKDAKNYIDMGCQFLEIGHELGILRSVWKSATTEIKNLEK